MAKWDHDDLVNKAYTNNHDSDRPDGMFGVKKYDLSTVKINDMNDLITASGFSEIKRTKNGSLQCYFGGARFEVWTVESMLVAINDYLKVAGGVT